MVWLPRDSGNPLNLHTAHSSIHGLLVHEIILQYQLTEVSKQELLHDCTLSCEDHVFYEKLTSTVWPYQYLICLSVTDVNHLRFDCARIRHKKIMMSFNGPTLSRPDRCLRGL